MKSFKGFLNKKTLSPDALAKKHGVSMKTIQSQLKMGTKVEREHTSKSEVAREIALDHIGEKPNYYTKLKKVD